jgi:integrase
VGGSKPSAKASVHSCAHALTQMKKSKFFKDSKRQGNYRKPQTANPQKRGGTGGALGSKHASGGRRMPGLCPPPRRPNHCAEGSRPQPGESDAPARRRCVHGNRFLQTFRIWSTLQKVTAAEAQKPMAKPVLRIVSPDTVKRKVTPRRPKNAEVRTREYLTEREVERLIDGCKGNRRPHRDQTMILLAFRHGLRASEVCDLQWTQVDFAAATLAVTRAKHGTPSTHPLTGRELQALRRLHREAEGRSPFLFVSERGSPMTVSNFQKLISRACEAAGLKIKAHPHMLRHACGRQAL